MSFLFVTYPVSLVTAAVLFFSGIIISTFFINILFIVFILFLLFTDCLTIAPLLQYFESFLAFRFQKNISIIKKNIQKVFTVHSSEPIEPIERQAIYLFNPHSLFSIAHAFHVGSTMTEWPVKKIKGATHSFLTSCPIVKDLINYTNRSVSANYKDMKEVLESGSSLSVSLGGMNESKYTETHKMVLNIKNRKGVFRMSLETGIPIVPTITYNENQLYKRIENPLISYLDSIIGIRMNIPTLASVCHWFTILKKPLDYTIPTYIGKPLEVVKTDTPTDEEIVELRERYFVALKKLYLETRPNTYTGDIEIV